MGYALQRVRRLQKRMHKKFSNRVFINTVSVLVAEILDIEKLGMFSKVIEI